MYFSLFGKTTRLASTPSIWFLQTFSQNNIPLAKFDYLTQAGALSPFPKGLWNTKFLDLASGITRTVSLWDRMYDINLEGKISPRSPQLSHFSTILCPHPKFSYVGDITEVIINRFFFVTIQDVFNSYKITVKDKVFGKLMETLN